MAENLGSKVVMQHEKFGAITLRNVTEIHWNYPKAILGPCVAFESDIHGTGNTYECRFVTEFETTLEVERAKAF